MILKKHKLLKNIKMPFPAAALQEVVFNLNLNMNNSRIENVVSDPTVPNDCCTQASLGPLILAAVKSTISEKFVPLTGTLSGKNITGNLTFDPAYTMTGLRNPTADSELANLQTTEIVIETSLYDLILKEGGVLQGNLNMNGYVIRGLPDPKPEEIPPTNPNPDPNPAPTPDPSLPPGYSPPPVDNSFGPAGDAISLRSLKTLIDRYANKHLNFDGTDQLMQGPLNFNGSGTIKNIADPVLDDDLITLKYLQGYLPTVTNSYLKTTGGTMTGDIDVNGFPVINIPAAIQDTQAADLLSVKNKIDPLLVAYFPIQGGTLTGTLSSSDVFYGLGEGTNLKDAVTYGQFVGQLNILFDTRTAVVGFKNNGLNDDVIHNKQLATAIDSISSEFVLSDEHLQSTTSTKLLFKRGSLLNTLTIPDCLLMSNSSDPLSGSDACTLLTLNTITNNLCDQYMKIDGSSTMTGDLNMNGNTLLTENSLCDNDPCNLSTMRSRMSLYVPTSGATIYGDLTVEGIINMGLPQNSNGLATKRIYDAEETPEIISKLRKYNNISSYNWAFNEFANWGWYDDDELKYSSTTENYKIGGPNGSFLYLTRSALYLLTVTVHPIFEYDASSETEINLILTLNGTDMTLCRFLLFRGSESVISIPVPCKFPQNTTSGYLSLKNIGQTTKISNLNWSVVSLCGIYQ